MEKTAEQYRLEASEQRLQRLERKVKIGHNVTAAAVGFGLGLTVVVIKNQRKMARNQVILAQNQTGLTTVLNRLIPGNH